jgi:hypothetical protein
LESVKVSSWGSPIPGIEASSQRWVAKVGDQRLVAPGRTIEYR